VGEATEVSGQVLLLLVMDAERDPAVSEKETRALESLLDHCRVCSAREQLTTTG